MTGCLSDVQSAKAFLHTIKRFGIFSGLQLNAEKTEGMWLGCQRDSEKIPLGISWPKRAIRTLGVYFSYDEAESNEWNFSKKITKCKQIMALWKSRNLSMYGRTQIIKTFIVFQFLYVTSAIYTPNIYVNELNHMIIDFIWWGRKPKLKREVLYLPKECGGLYVPNFRNLIHASYVKWLKRYDDENCNTLWKRSLKYVVLSTISILVYNFMQIIK